MTLERSIEAHADAIALAASLGSSSSPYEMGFKIELILRCADISESGGTAVDDETLLTVAEELGVPYPLERLADLALSTGFVERNAGSYSVRSSVDVGTLMTNARGVEANASLVRVAMKLRADTAQRSAATSMPSVDDCREAIARAVRWASAIAMYCTQHSLPGVPVFWRCDESGHRPLNRQVGSATTMDALALMSLDDGTSSDPSMVSSASDGSVEGLVTIVLEMQIPEGRDDAGGFAAPGHDEDYPGAIGPDASSRAPATVDSTGDALVALARAYRLISAELRSDVARAAAAAADFLVGQQQSEGAWGLYHYGAAFPSSPRAASSALAVEGLAATLVTHPTTDRSSPWRAAIDRYVEYAGSMRIDRGAERYWLPDFFREDLDDDASVDATVWVCRSLASAAPFSTSATDLLRDSIRYVARRWNPTRDAIMPVPMRVATSTGLSREDFQWELPRDAIVAELVLRTSTMLKDPSIAYDSWPKVTAALNDTIDDERHGHWLDLMMKRADPPAERAVPGNTRYHAEFLRTYLAFTKDRLCRS